MNKGLKHLLIEQEKRNGLTPERLFLDMLSGLEPKTNDRLPESVFYWKNGHIWFQQDNKNNRLWCSYDYVWSIFGTKYGYKYYEIRSFIKGMLEDIDNWKELIPTRSISTKAFSLEDMDNWKEKKM